MYGIIIYFMLVGIVNGLPLQTSLRDHKGRLMAELEFISKITVINSQIQPSCAKMNIMNCPSSDE